MQLPSCLLWLCVATDGNYVMPPGQGILTIMHKSLTDLISSGLQADALICTLYDCLPVSPCPFPLSL
jgi:hypothetical protein